MSAYPLYDQIKPSQPTPFDSTKVQASPGGKRVVLISHLAAVLGRIGEFNIRHKLTTAEKTTHIAHFDTNEFISFAFIYLALPDITWTCVYGPRPQYRRVNRTSTDWFAMVTLWAITNDE